MFTNLKNKTIYKDKYKSHDEAVIISCFFNSENSPYRLKAFNTFYDSIKHLNHRIIECIIGDAKSQLPDSKYIKKIHTESLLWHKEALLNKLVTELPSKFKYVFWVDADVLFTNLNWMVEGVEQLKTCQILQPFKYCVHLEKDQLKPAFKLPYNAIYPNQENSMVWRSFCSNLFIFLDIVSEENYNNHGHVGFAWGARRELLEKVPLYDRALIGGADHIIAHALVDSELHPCIKKAFIDKDMIAEIAQWTTKFNIAVGGRNNVGYVNGDLHHIWHGDINKRDYLNRIKKFSSINKNITYKDKHGLYISRNKKDQQFTKQYFQSREVSGGNGNFLTGLAAGYLLFGGNDKQEEPFTGKGGEFGGGGASDSWDNSFTSTIDSSPTIVVAETERFS